MSLKIVTVGDHNEAYSDGEIDRLWNRVAEHVDNEHTTSWSGCPVCEDNLELAEAVYGSLDKLIDL